MPELPEVETVVRGLRHALLGKTIRRFECNNPATLECDPGVAASAVCGKQICDVLRRGKHICLQLDKGATFSIHLRMSGKLLFTLGPKDEKYVRLHFRFADGSNLYFVDTRKFGRMKIWPPGRNPLEHLGPEPLDSHAVHEALARLKTRRPIKAVLLDQSVLAGIGNIYADEALFLAAIHPRRPAAGLGTGKRKRLSTVLPPGSCARPSAARARRCPTTGQPATSQAASRRDCGFTAGKANPA